MSFKLKQVCILKSLSVALALLLAGCSSRASMNSWKSGLEQHAAEQSNGDMTFLRDDGSGSPRRQFAVLGADSPDKSIDVSGVLLERRELAGTPWLVFLVGHVKSRAVDDVRVVLLSDDVGAGKQRWLIGGSDPKAIAAYQRYRQSAWRKYHPGRDEPPLNANVFPAEDDVYRTEIYGNTVTVIEETAGVRWTLVLPQSKS